MNADETRPHTNREDLIKEIVIEETDREERRKRSIRCTLLSVPEDPCWKDLNSYSSHRMGEQPRKENIICISKKSSY